MYQIFSTEVHKLWPFHHGAQQVQQTFNTHSQATFYHGKPYVSGWKKAWRVSKLFLPGDIFHCKSSRVWSKLNTSEMYYVTWQFLPIMFQVWQYPNVTATVITTTAATATMQ